MQYKTIILELLQQQPRMYEQFRKDRSLLETLERCAQVLKTNHEAWKEVLRQAKPASDPNQIASEALELALAQLEDLPGASPPKGPEPLSLDEAMAFIRRQTPHD